MNRRFLWADVIRILAIYLVIVVHSSILPQQLSQITFLNFISFALAKTCVPLFFMLSGALLLSKNEPEMVFFKKRFTRIILPWVFWTLIFLIFTISYSSLSSVKFVNAIKTSLRVFWFLPIISVFYLLTPSLRTFVREAKNFNLLLILILWYGLSSFAPYFRNTLAFPLPNNSVIIQLVDFSGYFLLGFLLTSTRISVKKNLSAIIILIGLLCTILGAYNSSLNKSTLDLSFFDYTSPTIVILSIGVFMFIYMSSLDLEKGIRERWKKLIGQVSKSTLGIYLFHTFVLQKFEFVNEKISIFSIHPAINNFLNGALIFIFCMMVMFLMQKIPYVKKLMS